MPTTASIAPCLESWRVVTRGSGLDQISDATVRLTAGGHRVVVNGEGRLVSDALASGLATGLQALEDLGVAVPDDARELLRQQTQAVPAPDEPGSTRLHVTARHENAMLTRMTSLFGQHDVDHFSYTVAADGRAHAVVGVCGNRWQVDRVAARLARVIGVLEVVTTEG